MVWALNSPSSKTADPENGGAEDNDCVCQAFAGPKTCASASAFLADAVHRETFIVARRGSIVCEQR